MHHTCKRILSMILCLALSFLLFSAGCGKEEKNVLNLPSTQQDEVLLICLDEFDSTIYKELSSVSILVFDIISSVPIEDASVKIDGINTPYLLYMNELQDVKLPYFVFLCYQNTDWQQMYELFKKDDSQTASNDGADSEGTFNDYFSRYQEEFSNIGQDEYIKLYQYEATVEFKLHDSDIQTNESLNAITLTVNGKEYTKNIGNLTLDYETEGSFTRYGTIPVNIATWNKRILPNREGIVTVDDFEFTCTEDITITGFSLLDKNQSVSKVVFNTETDGEAMDRIWDGNPAEFAAGTVLKPVIDVYDEALIDRNMYYTNVYVVMDYKANGQSCRSIFYSMFRTRPNAYEVYAAEVDGVNVLSYYIDFYNKTMQ